ncbi:hypothetical protein C7974DRAFT_449101 [Boeremia exigua]|uniref:uncharacterized protein n=1 Tax=Boeremia exigua TaxID=749465 RepID=UPI001E8E3816|nr:uncharacterized protein C7974DRAFT_449101 [Boeremia exigua]KAH6639165.1 hypothetical protein C7974DRAFT_449101 [Boeremia exigua]
MVTLIDLLSTTYAPIQTMILPYLDVGDVIALGRTCKGFGQIQPVLEATTYNINHQLKKFFQDPIEFRSVLGECNGLIGRDFARQFLSLSKIATDTLVLYVGGAGAGPRKKLLDIIRTNGYELENETFGEFSKQNGTHGRLYIDSCNWETTAITCLLGEARTTADVSFISWNKAYSLFPYHNFIKKESFMLEFIDDDYSRVNLNNLTNEGIKTKTVSWSHRKHTFKVSDAGYDDADELRRRRRIGDTFSWVLNLDVEGVQPSHVPDTVLEISTFRLQLSSKYANDWQVTNYEVEFEDIISHPVLRHRYITLTEDTCYDDDELSLFDANGQRIRTSHFTRRCDELCDRLDELTLVELTKIPSAERPPQFAQLSAGHGAIKEAHKTRGLFKLPSTWTFYDDEVIAFLNKTWVEQQLLDKREEARRKAMFFELAEKEQMEAIKKGRRAREELE